MDLTRIRQEIDFQIGHMQPVRALAATARYEGLDDEVIRGVLDTAHKIADDLFSPCAAELDRDEPRLEQGQVVVPETLKRALAGYVEAGLMGATFDHEDGGLQLPVSIGSAVSVLLSASNLAASGYPLLTVAAARLQSNFGSDEQKQRYMTPMIEGRYFGTMCLSEPHAGSSLADIRTQAVPMEDGTFKIRGSKMWISGADHEISENIVHHVLARLPDAPAGVQGISLFIVPKHRVDAQGKLGQRNDVAVASLNHKMGYRGTVNAALNFGENDACIGTMVGQPNQGLRYMFQMMNEARIGVGLGAAALGLAGYAVSLDYARERKQGRALDNPDPGGEQVPIIAHPDVRRLLMKQKIYSEGAISLLFYCAMLVDQELAGTSEAPEELAALLGLLTPIAKTYPSEYCLEANQLAIQVLGGAGYTRDWPLERMYRDNRLNPIHEGTTGIQGLDLLGRKVLGDGGAALALLWREISATETQAHALPDLADAAAALAAARIRISELTKSYGAQAQRDGRARVLVHATAYQDAMSQIVIGWMWLRQALVAQGLLDADKGGDHAAGKIAACRYFFAQDFKRLNWLFDVLESNDPEVTGLSDAVF